MIARSGSRPRLERLAPPRVGRDLVAVALKGLRVVGADGGVVLDDGDAACHAADYTGTPSRNMRGKGASFFCHLSSVNRHFRGPRRALSGVAIAATEKEQR